LEQRQVGRQVEAGAHDDRQRLGREPLGLPLGAELVGLGDAPVALGAGRPGADHHGVGLGAEVVEELAVELAGDPLGPPVDRGLAVERGDHVEAQIRPVLGSALGQPQAGGELAGRDGAALGQDELHARSLFVHARDFGRGLVLDW
jgi:hypothetical protein